MWGKSPTFAEFNRCKMIQLCNVSKTYYSKKKSITKALDNINLSFPSKGMVFLVGKSGCGKSTLLNILGAIDNPTEGKLFFNDKDFSTFTENEKDYYRGHEVGFVFQDYNLISDFTIMQNLKLAKEICGSIVTDEEIKNALAKVGLEEYENHFPSEMSGGQQQRAAIARALLKNPNIILADEPTGNLDIKTSKEIFNILKELSKEKLVIIVSHNIEIAESFSDRLIEIINGKIDSDKNTQDNDGNRIVSFAANFNNKTGLKLKHIFKISLSNFKRRTLVLVIAILICSAAIVCGIYAQALSDFKSYEKIPLSMEKNNVIHFSLIKTDKYYSLSSTDTIFTEEFENLKNTYSNNPLFLTQYNSATIINNKEDIKTFGFILSDNSRELDDFSIYVTDVFAKTQLEMYSFYHKINDKYESITKVEDFIGDLYNGKSDEFKIFTVAGIVITGFSDYKKTEYKSKMEESLYENYFGRYLNYFCTANYIRQLDNEEYDNIVSITNSSVTYGGIIKENNFIYRNLRGFDSASILLYQDGKMYRGVDSTMISENECIIPLTLYNELFSTNYRANNFCDLNNFSFIPLEMPELGQKIKLTIVGEDKKLEFKDLKVVGIAFRPTFLDYNTDSNKIYLTQSNIDSFKTHFNLKIQYIKGIAFDFQELSQLLKNNPSYFVKTIYSKEIYNYEASYLNSTKDIIFIFSIVLLSSAIFITYYYISSIINQDKRKIGIFRSLGATSLNIVGIYLIQGLIIALLITSIAASCAFPVVHLANKAYSVEMIEGIIMLSFSPLMIIELLFTSVITVLLAVIIPTIKLSKMKPIDVIRKI